jgi:hypothetical protein
MTTAATEVVTYQMFINGEWVDAASGQTFDSMNPYTGKAWAQMPDAQEEDVDRAVAAARQALENPAWKRMPPMQRGHLLRRLADLLQDNAEHLGHIETRDNGKLIREMLGQARALPSYYHYYAGLADKILGVDVLISSQAAVDGLSEQRHQLVSDVAAGAALMKVMGGSFCQPKGLIKLTAGKESSIGCDNGAAKLYPDFGVEFQFERSIIAVTHRVSPK